MGQIPARVPVRHDLSNSGVHWRFPSLAVMLQPREFQPDSPAYSKIAKLEELSSLVSLVTALHRQKRNYDNNRRELEFSECDRIWVRAHPLSKASQSFMAKLAPKWQGPYRVAQWVGPVNYQVVLEYSGEDSVNLT